MCPPLPTWDDFRPREACGVVGVRALDGQVLAAGSLVQAALLAQQHRGQESAGCVVAGPDRRWTRKATGLVRDALPAHQMATLFGTVALGHVRYSTNGNRDISGCQPAIQEAHWGWMATAHNGHLRWLRAHSAREQRDIDRVRLTSEAAAIGAWIARRVEPSPDSGGGVDLTRPIRDFMRQSQGAYSAVLATQEALWAFRDPRGMRPLCLGVLPDGVGGRAGHMVASETCALDAVGATLIREILPGEIVRIDGQGVVSRRGLVAEGRAALCVFEHVYFSRPESILQGRRVGEVRTRLGAGLAEQSPVEADVVVGVPDSALPAARGYAARAGLPLVPGLIRDPTRGRTFILPTTAERQEAAAGKYAAVAEAVRGKRVVLVDDSVVRAHTAKVLVAMLRASGAREVHLRVGSPPVRHPCYMGVDMASHDELVGHRLDQDATRREIGADSLAYLSLEGMFDAVVAAPSPGRTRGTEPTATAPRHDGPQHCAACFDGRYPFDTSAATGALETTTAQAVPNAAAPLPDQAGSPATLRSRR